MTKFTSRFSASIVRAAEMLDTFEAAVRTPVEHKCAKGAVDVFDSAWQQYDALMMRTAGSSKEHRQRFSSQVKQCVAEMRAERVQRAKARRERQQAREAERARLIADGAFA